VSKVWYCVNCGYEVGSRGRCHRCRVKLDLSPLPELEVGDEDDEVGYRLDDWEDAARGKLIVALIRANVRHRFEDDELVVGADDEARVDDLVAAVAEIPDDATEDDDVVFAVTPAAPSEGVSRNRGDNYVPGFGELDPRGRPVDAFVTTPLTGAEFQVIADQVKLLHAAAHRLQADPTDMEADGQVAEASAAVFVTDRFRGVDADTWAAVGRTTRRLLAALGAEEAQEDEITRQAAILSALLDVVADDARVVAALAAKEDEDRLAAAAEGQDLDDDSLQPHADAADADAADEDVAGEDVADQAVVDQGVAEDGQSRAAVGQDGDGIATVVAGDETDDQLGAETEADGDESGRAAGAGYNPDEETVYELPVEWLPEQRAELTILLHAAGIEPKWDRGDLVVPADREADVEGLFDRIHGTQNTDEQDEAQYQEISELFAATSRLAGDPDDLGRATEVLRTLGAVDGSTPFGFDGLKWTAIRKRARLLADSIEGKAQPDLIGTEAGSLRDLLRELV
jgi:hypothetical protein